MTIHSISALTKIASVALASAALGACGRGGDGGSSPPTVIVTPPAPPPTAVPPPPPPTSPYPVGLSASTIASGGVARDFLVYRPAGVVTAKGIVLVLHGGGGSGSVVANGGALSVFKSIADREGLVAIFPSGIDSNWNDCRPTGGTNTTTADDVTFFDVLLDRVQREFGVASGRVLVAGHSNGGMMAMRYAFERPTRVAAIASASANLPATPEPGACTSGPVRPVPILLTHSVADRFALFGGGCFDEVGGVCPVGGVIGAEATRDRWLAINNLTALQPSITTVELVANDGGPAIQHRYGSAPGVEWWRLEGAGHAPQSRLFTSSNSLVGPQNQDIEFAEVAWSFAAPLFR